MAEFDLPSDLHRGPDETRRRLLAADPYPPLAAPPLDPPGSHPAMSWTPDEQLRSEMARLEAGFATADPPAGPYPTDSVPGGVPPAYLATPLSDALAPYATGSGDDIARLRSENEEMHKLIEEMKHIFEQASSQEDANSHALEEHRAKIAELQRELHDRDDRVALLTGQIGELEKHIQESPAAPPPPPSEDDLAKLADELEKERCSLARDRRTVDQERQQLKEDEEALMNQMREMEVQMAKERAELARQRTDLQRLHSEVRHELEQLQRGDGALKDRLAQFQRRHQAVFDRSSPSAPAPTPAPVAATPAVAEPTNGHGDSGFVRRLFGRS
jgi:uncharacterized coiled-coil protein SlyX